MINFCPALCYCFFADLTNIRHSFVFGSPGLKINEMTAIRPDHDCLNTDSVYICFCNHLIINLHHPSNQK